MQEEGQGRRIYGHQTKSFTLSCLCVCVCVNVCMYVCVYVRLTLCLMIHRKCKGGQPLVPGPSPCVLSVYS